MLSAAELKPFLLHADADVRVAAVQYFRDSCSQDGALLPLVLEAWERYGEQAGREFLCPAEVFRLTAESFPRVLAACQSSAGQDVQWSFGAMLAHAPLGLLHANEAAVRAAAPADWQRTIECRLEVADWPADRLLERLRELSDEWQHEYVNKIDHAYTSALIEALARRDWPDPAGLYDLLAAAELEDSYLECFLIDLAGERGAAAAIPVLVKKLHSEGDYTLERAKAALARIGGVEVIREVRAVFPNETWDFKNYAASLFGDIKLVEAEDAALELLEQEQARDIRTYFCDALCRLFSRRGLEVVRREIAAGYDSMLIGLDEEILPILTVLGIELPEAPEWRRAKAERDERRFKRARELAEWGRRKWLAEHDPGPTAAGAEADVGTEGALERQLPDAGRRSGARRGVAEEYEPEEPYRRVEPKVGRNEPCPCGSGKKYKKCCGRE